MPERLDIFYKMLFDCYGIWGWEYDEEMNLLYANSESPYFHGLLLLGRNREQVIRERGCADDAPLIISNSIGTKSAQPVRQAKYSVVAFITLCTRAAIEGGLSSECAYTLSDTYTEAVDNAHTIGEIASVSHTMYEDFIRRVNRLRRESGISRPIRLCCDYMDNHLEEELELKKLAERVGYTDYYLARKFKAEMGISINAYIRRERVRYSGQLLASTKLTIEEIGERLHFCSRSYFAKAFREETGMTPGEYRARYGGLNADGR